MRRRTKQTLLLRLSHPVLLIYDNVASLIFGAYVIRACQEMTDDAGYPFSACNLAKLIDLTLYYIHHTAVIFSRSHDVKTQPASATFDDGVRVKSVT